MEEKIEESNRASARRSRTGKQKQREDLINEKIALQNENSQLVQRIGTASQRYNEMEAANDVLRAQAMELTERLRSLNSVLQLAEDVSGTTVDIPKTPVSFMEPWQLPCPVQPIMASAEMLQY
ncbi:hypothetical protein SLE2022_331740 [Rubroshorea leprosula]